MFDIGAAELLVIAVVAILVIGPKDMPLALRTAGRWIGQIRRVSGHFRAGIDAMVREAEMEEMEKKWKERNAEIMRAHPGDEMTPLPPKAPGEDEGEADAGPGVHDPDAGLKVKGQRRKAKSRSIPLNAEARAARDQILADHDGGSLFFSRLHRNTWNQKLKAARKAAGLDRGTLHSLRHTPFLSAELPITAQRSI